MHGKEQVGYFSDTLDNQRTGVCMPLFTHEKPPCAAHSATNVRPQQRKRKHLNRISLSAHYYTINSTVPSVCRPPGHGDGC
ncbi:unnamed protein product [Chondrus crispus]|uniref:Uncharacterized protein n=1 Tax=Chondrus crispus TaxID=2769 RepID=R7QJU4_CHOCR|nr:unnamed protein product [Chondrus crispus]CDF37685.1 unnamed protein product [Chondrus crispus]|eukprot:XP_005717556.1 unnamed protein product [Chondrus crispus]